MTIEQDIRQRLQSFDLVGLFVDTLGWDRLKARPLSVEADGATYVLTGIAHKRGMIAYLCDSASDLPSGKVRRLIEQQVVRSAHEHVVIYVDPPQSTQVWQWVRREPGKPSVPRYHRYDRGQTGDGLAQRLAYLAFSLEDEEVLSIVDVTARARQAFDYIERVTRRFYERFKREHDSFLGFVTGVTSVGDREWYASVMLNRLMFVYFIQKKGFLDGDPDYLRNRLAAVSAARGPGEFLSFYRRFLLRLFHEGLATPAPRSTELDKLMGKVPYLNGGLFEVHELEERYPEIDIPDEAFGRVFDFFDEYQWHLDDRPLRSEREINPDVLGYIFEKYINQRQMGAYYTREDITGYITANTIVPVLVDALARRLPEQFGPEGAAWELLRRDPNRFIPAVVQTEGLLPAESDREREARLARLARLRDCVASGKIRSIDDCITENLDARQVLADFISFAGDLGPALALAEELRSLTVLDPTCGSGAFLFAALNVLRPLYDACLDAFESWRDEGGVLPQNATATLAEVAVHPSRDYFVLKSIIVNNLYGVDIMEEAVEIAKLRFFLKLVAEVTEPGLLEPLPDIDFNIRAGNTLVGFATIESIRHAVLGRSQSRFDLEGVLPTLEGAAAAADEAFSRFRHLQTGGGSLEALTAAKTDYRARLSELRLQLDSHLARERGARTKEDVRRWVTAHQPFHWFVEFWGTLRSGGFDVVVGNPPYVGYAKTGTSLMTGVGSPFASLFRDFDTCDTGNLYSLVVERSADLLANGGRWGMIVPLSLTFSRDFVSLRKLLGTRTSRIWYASFDNIPDRAFTGSKESDNTSTANQQRVTIFVADSRATSHDRRLYSTPTLRWRAIERERLFADLPYDDVTECASSAAWPKVGRTGRDIALLREVRAWNPLGTLMVSASSHRLVVPKTAGYYIAAYADAKDRSKQMVLSFRDADARKLGLVLLNSDFFFWWYRVFGDGFDVTQTLVESCPVPVRPDGTYRNLADRLIQAQGECTVYKAYRGEQVPNVNYNLRMDLLLDCDRWVASHLTGEWPFDWEALLRYKSSSWFSFEIAKAASWPAPHAALGARNGQYSPD